jgi:hypothetical protein
MSTGVVLTMVAVALALVIAGLFRLLGVLDSAELTLRRLAAGIRDTRRHIGAAGELAASVERDAVQGQVELQRLEDLKRNPKEGP